MPIIQCLDSHVADLIAAGEVVERPASVAKELLETPWTPGPPPFLWRYSTGVSPICASPITAAASRHRSFPRPFCAMPPASSAGGGSLAAIGTLGFRGEALAAIAAVSRVDIFSRERGADQGASLHLEGGVPGEVTETGCPEGTTLCVRDLFYNTPARMKFMKKDTAEACRRSPALSPTWP